MVIYNAFFSQQCNDMSPNCLVPFDSRSSYPSEVCSNSFPLLCDRDTYSSWGHLHRLLLRMCAYKAICLSISLVENLFNSLFSSSPLSFALTLSRSFLLDNLYQYVRVFDMQDLSEPLHLESVIFVSICFRELYWGKSIH